MGTKTAGHYQMHMAEKIAKNETAVNGAVRGCLTKNTALKPMKLLPYEIFSSEVVIIARKF